MNLVLLHTREVVEAVEAACRSGAAPINSVEGFVRQVIGWREYGVSGHVHVHGYAQRIERMMVVGIPKVIGVALFADGGVMATKPYASGGASINKTSDSCRSCRYDPKQRTGPDVCPYTTLYWDFLARNEHTLAGNHRMACQLAAMRKLSVLPAVRERAIEVLSLLDEGRL